VQQHAYGTPPIASFAGQSCGEIEACEKAQVQHYLCNLPLTIPSGFWGKCLANILVVDDDPAVQTTIRLLLERAGHAVTVAADGRKGLAAFETGNFDLLFLDIFMPGMDGLETMRHIHRQRPTTPIIVISGRPLVADAGAEPDFLAMSIKLGAISSLSKPFKPAALLATVESCLKSREPDVAGC
jgi:CheY-like chemotaxis protein